MDSEILNIIDTAVKIGLGALISGIATYSVTRARFTHDDNKERLRRRLDSIESAAESINKFIVALGDLISTIDGVRISQPEMKSIDSDSLVFIAKSDEQYNMATKHISSASVKLRLLGLESIAEILADLETLAHSVRTKVLFNQQMPTETDVTKWFSDMSNIKNTFFKTMSKEYDA